MEWSPPCLTLTCERDRARTKPLNGQLPGCQPHLWYKSHKPSSGGGGRRPTNKLIIKYFLNEFFIRTCGIPEQEPRARARAQLLRTQL